MLKRIVFGIMFVMPLIGMLTLAFDVQPVRAELKTWTVGGDEPADFSKKRDAVTVADIAYTSQASRKHSSIPTIESFFENGLDKRLVDIFEVRGKWDFGNETKWCDFAYVDADSAELVIGLSDVRPNSYSELVDLSRSYGGKLVNTVAMYGEIRAVVADIPHGVMPTFVSEVEVAGLSRYIEPNMRFEIDFVPNDPDWPKQWGPRIIEADEAWKATMGDPSVLVAVVDTGVDWDHPDLAANYVSLGYDWVNADTDPMDDNGHGTHCAGIIAAVLNNSIGIAGLAQVGIMVEKGLDQYGSGLADDLANAIVHAVDQGADILSNSWGGFGESALVYEAVKYAHDHGVLVIASAGNDATECEQCPAEYEETVAVTATNKSDDPAWWTNFGDWVELAAPGVQIYSTWRNDTYRSSSGTSMSAPHVAGVAALIWSQFPNMTRDQVRAQLRYTTDDFGDPGFDEYYGYGRVNARRAVEKAPPNHDLALLYWKVPSILKPFDTVTINGTLLNSGANNESDITVRLLVNGSVAESAFVSHLVSGASTMVSFVWSPTVEGKYNVTLYVAPVDGEILTENNILFRYVIVRLLDEVFVPNDFPTVQKAINKVSPGYTIRVKSGIYYEHIIISKSVTLLGENRQTTIIDGNGILQVVWIVANNANVTGFTVQNGWYGMFLFDSYYHNIGRNIMTNNREGMRLYCSGSNTLRDNSMTGNECNFCVTGYHLSHLIHDIDTSNTVDGKPVYYWTDRRDVAVPLDAGYVALVNCTGITVQDLNLTNNNAQGVLLAFTTNSIIIGNNIENNRCGMDLWNSNNCTIVKNVITRCFDGIALDRCNNITIQSNDIMLIRYKDILGEKRWGIILWASSNNTISGNEVTETHTGIYLSKSSCNNIVDNTIANNGIGNSCDYSGNNTVIANLITENLVGIDLSGSGDNVIHHNDIINNEEQVRSQDSINTWDDGYPSGGNYWSDYIGEDMKSGPDQNQPGSDGICDTQYVIDVDNRDHYPLWYPWTLPTAEHELVVFLEAPTIIPLGYPSLLNVTVVNKGLNNETSMELLLMIDGNIVNSTIVSFLQAGSFCMIDYQWTPTIEGIYNVTAYAPPVLTEEFTANNIVAKTVSVFALTSIYVDPLESTVILGETFTVNVSVAAVEDLYAWQVKLCFDPAVLNGTGVWLPSDNVFADKDPATLALIVNNAEGYVFAAASLVGQIPSFIGSGILCQIEFRAIGLGTSSLSLGQYGESLGTILADARPIPDVMMIDGLVEVVPLVPPHGPKAEFTMMPETTCACKVIKFNASASLPGWNGTHAMPIVEYRWDFGDGNKTTTSTPIIHHVYKTAGINYVTLTVYAPGSTPETDTISRKVTINSVPVGGCSFPIKGYTTTKPLTPYLASVAILTAILTVIRRKTHRRTKHPETPFSTNS